MSADADLSNDLRQDSANRLTVAGLKLPQWRRVWLVVAIAIAVALPLMASNFTIFQFTMAAIYAIAILGLNLLTGFNGQFSLGHSAFFAVGAYTTAILMDQWGLAYYWTLIPAGIVAFIFGFLFGVPALRLEGLYLALATFALAVATPQLLKYKYLEHWTGGVQGIFLDKPETPFGMPINDDQWIYYFVLGIVALMFLAAWNLVRGRSGRAMIAIRDNPIAAATMGINTAMVKSLTFGVSALFTGIAGALSAVVVQYVAPDSFTFLLAVSFLVGLVIGGVGSIPGALIGGIVILFLPNIAEEISKGLSWAVYGLFLIAAVYLMPTGAAGLVRWLTTRLIKRG